MRNKTNPSKVNYIRCRSWPGNVKTLPWTDFSVLAIWNNFSASLSASEMLLSSLSSCHSLTGQHCGNTELKDFCFTMAAFLIHSTLQSIDPLLRQRNAKQDMEIKSAQILQILTYVIFHCFWRDTCRKRVELIKSFRDVSYKPRHRACKSVLETWRDLKKCFKLHQCDKRRDSC